MEKSRGGVRRGRRAAWMQGGFSLLELLIVIAVMGMLSTLAVTSYISAIRGMAARSARQHFEDTLLMARQQALISGLRVSLIAYNEPRKFGADGNITESAAMYVVCRELGRISNVQGGTLVDEYSNIEKTFGTRQSMEEVYGSGASVGSVTLYNLETGKRSYVKPYVETSSSTGGVKPFYSNFKDGATGRLEQYERYAFVVDSSDTRSDAVWKPGDPYGVEVSPPRALPRDYYFKGLKYDNVTKMSYVTFEPDGSRTSRSDGSFSIQFGAQTDDDTGDLEDVGITFTIAPNGKITVTD